MDSKIKVMYFTTTSKLCGAEKIILELSKRINKEHFEIMVCTIKNDLEDGLLDKVRDIGMQTASLCVENKWQFCKSFRLYKIIKDFNPDIIQSFLFFDNILARIIGKLAGVPIIISGQRNVPLTIPFLRNLAEKFTISFSNLIISNTNGGKNWLINKFRLNSERVKIIYNGIGLEEIDYIKKDELLKEIGLSGDEKIVGFIGRLERQKGVKYLIDAIRILSDESPSIYALIIGDEKEEDALKKYADSLNCNVIFLGWKDNASQYFSIFDMFVLPSLWEGMPNVILEAMWNEMPVIATKVGGNAEIIEDGKTGFLIEPGNSQALAEKILEVISLSESKKQSIIRNAKNKVINDFNIDKTVKEFEDTYLALLSKKRM